MTTEKMMDPLEMLLDAARYIERQKPAWAKSARDAVARARSSAVGAGAREALEAVAIMHEVEAARLDPVGPVGINVYSHRINTALLHRRWMRKMQNMADALQSEPVQPAGKGEIEPEQVCDCQQPEEINGIRLISNSCPVHNENPDPPSWPDTQQCDCDPPLGSLCARCAWETDVRPEAPAGMREALERVLQDIVIAIAFLGRDAGTERLPSTMEGLTARLAIADQRLRTVLSILPSDPVRRTTQGSET